MFKRLSAIILMLCISLASSAVFAEESGKSQLFNQLNTAMETYTSKVANIQKPEAFSGIVDCYDRAKVQNIYAYTNFIYSQGFNTSEMQIVNRILAKGTTIQSLIEVYNFWLTTDESFDMIERICELEDEYFSEYWYEDAFNKLTNYEHGELSVEDIVNYRADGITTDEILAANVMSRKKGQNIVAILDAHLEGNTLEKQIVSLYGVSEISQEETLFSAVKSIAESSKRQNTQFSTLRLSEKTEEFAKIISDKVKSDMQRLNITEETPQDVFSDYNALRNSGYPINVQKALMNKGYTPEEIEKSVQFLDMGIHEAVKKAREMVNNEE